MEGRRRLRDLLAVPARELLSHRLDDLPLARDHFQRLGDVLAQLRQLRRSAARTLLRRGDVRATRAASAEPSTRTRSPPSELDLDGCRASRDFPSPRRWHLLSCIRRRRLLATLTGANVSAGTALGSDRLSLTSPLRQRLAAPREQLARVDAALPCNLRHRVARTARLFDELELLFLAPPPSPLRPCDDLDPPAHRPCA